MGQKKRSPGQGLKLLLIRDYLYNEATKEHPKNSKTIIAYLAEHDIKASVTTIHTDIMRLREDLGIPIAYNPNKFGYYISEPKFDIAELEVLIDCIQYSPFMTEGDASRLIGKIKGLTNVHDRKKIDQRLREDNKQQTGSIIQNIQLINEAIHKKCKIRFQMIRYVAEHTTHTAVEPATVFASPHKLTWQSGKYILEYAFDSYFDEAAFKAEEKAFFDECIGDDYQGGFEAYYKAQYGERHERSGTGSQIYCSTDLSLLTNIKVTNLPSTYQKPEKKPTTENTIVIDWGKERAVTIRFRKEMLKRVVADLGKDAVLISEDEYYFTTTVKRRFDGEFFRWLSGYGCYATILTPKEAIDGYLNWHRHGLVEQEILYEYGLEPYDVLTADEYWELSEDDDKILTAAATGKWKCHHELLISDDAFIEDEGEK